MSSINVMVPPPRRDTRATSAEPPLPKGTKVHTMAEWKAEREKRRAMPLWRRLLGRVGS